MEFIYKVKDQQSLNLDTDMIQEDVIKNKCGLDYKSKKNANELCLWDESDYKPCELQAIDCENCDYFGTEDEEE